MKPKWENAVALWRFIFPYLLLFILWWCAQYFIPRYLIPGPVAVFYGVIRMLISANERREIYASLIHIFVGVGLSIVLGTLIGIIFGFIKGIRLYFEGAMPFFQSIPGISWAFISLIWFGLSDMSVIFVIFISTFASMVLNVWEGTKNVDPLLIKMARSFGYRRGKLLTSLYIPAILPFVISGIRVVMGLGWKVAVVAEMVVGDNGLGHELYTAAYALDTTTVLAGSLIIVILMMVIEYGVLRVVEKRVMMWRQN